MSDERTSVILCPACREPMALKRRDGNEEDYACSRGSCDYTASVHYSKSSDETRLLGGETLEERAKRTGSWFPGDV